MAEKWDVERKQVVGDRLAGPGWSLGGDVPKAKGMWARAWEPDVGQDSSPQKWYHAVGARARDHQDTKSNRSHKANQGKNQGGRLLKT